jgi:diguanylate cyclase (GGDEF)-like protein
MFDLDHFKNINDTYGHNNGDIVLTAFGKLMRDSLRLEDTWGRWGGEEFVVMFPGRDMDEAYTIIERLRAACETNMIELADDVTVFINVSAGISRIDIDESQKNIDVEIILTDAIERADKQLYIAKESGRNRVCCEGMDLNKNIIADNIEEEKNAG